MASTSAPNTPPEAPWKATFKEHISKMQSPEFVFSSLHPAPQGSPVPYVPRARYCIMRSFWAELPDNKHNTAPMNDRIYESDMPVFTTDVRMQKPFELFSSSSGKADREGLVKGSGGGGPVEAVWWVKDVMVQWRMKGEAFVIGPDIEEEGEQSSGVRTAKSELGKRMRVVKEEGKEGWSWKTEVTGHFGNMSPGMRGTFAAPPPGQPVSAPYDDQKLKLGEKVESLDDPVARENFRVVVIKPEEVESVDLSDPKQSRRQVYKFDEHTQSWSHEECWP
ncbi:zn 2cys6 transcription factor like [Lecanosticta acicola]|uniref:Zn 2cys6 transcription factor like n=1 Tax=Lecanosticta acicola TaxID=111012 RepID=A0AAI9EBY2_9PEZI|nr:zn 2cys6 transcription factor like [Lecanosticta acicola]